MPNQTPPTKKKGKNTPRGEGVPPFKEKNSFVS